ncbi:hypothetical protein FKM82_021802 [Ascaphus truei]
MFYIDVNKTIQTDVYRKPNSRNAFLMANSNHSRPLKRGILKGQFLRLKRLCSTEESFETQAMDLVHRFLMRGYDQVHIMESLDVVRSLNRVDLLPRSDKSNPKRGRGNIPSNKGMDKRGPFFITQQCKQADSIRNIIYKHWDTLKLDMDLQNIVNGGPKFVFKKANSLAAFLSPSLFNSHRQQRISNIPKGFFKCGHCVICQYAILIASIQSLKPKRKI